MNRKVSLLDKDSLNNLVLYLKYSNEIEVQVLEKDEFGKEHELESYKAQIKEFKYKGYNSTEKILIKIFSGKYGEDNLTLKDFKDDQQQYRRLNLITEFNLDELIHLIK